MEDPATELKLTAAEAKLYHSCKDNGDLKRFRGKQVPMTVLLLLLFAVTALVLDHALYTALLMSFYVLLDMFEIIRLRNVCRGFRKLLRKQGERLYQETGRNEYYGMAAHCRDSSFVRALRANSVLLSLFTVFAMLAMGYFYVPRGTAIVQDILLLLYVLISLGMKRKVIQHLMACKRTVFELDRELVRLAEEGL